MACPESNKGSVTIELPNSGEYHALWTESISGDTLDEDDFEGTNTLDNISDGTYNVLLTDENGCTFSFSYTVNAETYTVDFNQSEDTICAGEIVTFTVNTNEDVETYSWVFGDGGTSSESNTTHLYGIAGSFDAQLVIQNTTLGCSAEAEHPVFVREVIVADFQSTAPNCAGAPIYFTDLSSASPKSWEWDFAGLGTSEAQNPEFVFANPGTYTVTVTVEDNYCGSSSDTATLTVNSFPVVNLDPDTSRICTGQSVTFSAGNQGDSYVWSTGATSETITQFFTESQIVSVTVDHLGCLASDSAYVNVACYLYMPNAFSPNGDNTNDFFHPVGQNIINYEMHIYDRWGRLIYNKSNVTPGAENEGWDGKINGEHAEIGSYSFYVKGVLLDNFTVEETGSVTLIR